MPSSSEADSDGESLKEVAVHPKRDAKELKCAALSSSGLSTSISVTINGRRTDCLVDTGSPTTLISSQHATRCRLEVKPYQGNKRWRGPVGEALRVRGQASATLSFDGHEVEVVAIVIDGLVHDFLIGTGFMVKNGFKLDMKAGVLSVGDKLVDMNVVANEESCVVCTAIDVYVPARSERAVWLKANIKGPIVVERHESCPAKLMEGVHEVNDAGVFRIVLRNTRRSPVHLEAGTAVGRVHKAAIEGYWLNSSGSSDEGVNAVSENVWCPGEEAKIDASNMDAATAEKYRSLINRNADVFSKDDSDIGHSHIQHDIRLVDYKPFKARAYRIPAMQTEIVEKHVKEMLAMGVIKTSASPYASPIVLVKKADNSIRFCVDYRKLNSVTVKDSYPMPLIEERIDSIFGSQIFSGLDLTSGYWQFALTTSATELTAFICHLGLFEFLRMPFGLCNAGATFQRAMEEVLRGLKFAMAYVDDVLVHSKCNEDHLSHLQEVFDRLR